MSEDWQFCFRVKGLGIPEKEVQFGDDIIMRGVPLSDKSDVYFKVTTKTEKETEEMRKFLKNELMSILRIYSVVANLNTEPTRCDSRTRISSDTPFGDRSLSPKFDFHPVIPEDQRIKTIPLIEKTISIYRENKDAFKEKQKGFLVNALDYYLRSLGDLRLEEKLIDLMIALESLFSSKSEKQELRRSYSLRASYVLSVGNEKNRAQVYDNIYELYGKRNNVVHGTYGVELNRRKLFIFQNHMREAIKLFICLELPKDDFLEILDKSVYDGSSKKLLNELVKKAIEKWG